jgi:hypothetical protein
LDRDRRVFGRGGVSNETLAAALEVLPTGVRLRGSF